MRILLVNQFFWPDNAATSQLLTDVARRLIDLGHDVEVVCGNANYSAQDASAEPPVLIRRSPTLPFGRSKLARLLSYFSYLATATVTGLFSPRFDLILTLTTPPLVSLLGNALKLVRSSRHYIWEMDMYPDIAVDLGVMKEASPLTKIVGFLADRSRSHADGVIALGPCMRERLIARGLDPARIHVAENWADGETIHPLPFGSEGRLKILYSGNLGLAHDVDTVFDAMLSLRDDERFQFIFAGGGALRAGLQARCERSRVANAIFRSYCGRGMLGQSLGEGDLGLVTQKSTCSGSVVPSKVYGLMAAGRPLLYIGPRDSTPARLIQKFRCGWHVDTADSEGLVSLLDLLHREPNMLRDAGERGRQAFLEHYDLPIGVARICSIIGAESYAAEPAWPNADANPELASTSGTAPGTRFTGRPSPPMPQLPS